MRLRRGGKNGIRSSGIVGSKTWHKLVGSQPADLTGDGLGPEVPRFVVLPGDTDDTHLAYLGNVLWRTIDHQALHDWDGESYSAAPQSMVKSFQRKVGINPSGIVGPKTWFALYKVTSINGGWGC